MNGIDFLAVKNAIILSSTNICMETKNHFTEYLDILEDDNTAQ